MGKWMASNLAKYGHRFADAPVTGLEQRAKDAMIKVFEKELGVAFRIKRK